MKKKLVFLIVFALGIVSFALDQNLVIKEIEILNNREVPDHVIISIMENKKGEIFSTEKMLNDYQNMKETNYFEAINIHPKPHLDGVKLFVEVQESQNISKELKEKSVPAKKTSGGADKVYIASVKVKGNKSISSKEIKKFLDLNEGQYYSKDKLVESYQKLISSGWFKKIDPKVTQSGKGVNVLFVVEENPVVRGINIVGNTIYKPNVLGNLLTTKVGEVINIADMKKDGESIIEKYHNDGYVLARISNVQLTPENEINIEISEGIIKEIIVKKMATKQKGQRRVPNDNNLKTELYVIEREFEIKEGEIFNINAYDSTVENLMRLGHFKSVNREAYSSPENPNEVSVVLLIDEAKTATVSGSFSYGTETGASVAGSLKETNLFGKSQELSFNVEKSNKNYTGFNIDYYDPWIKGTDRISWGASIYRNAEGNEGSALFNRVDVLGASANVGKSIGRNLRLNVGARYDRKKEKHNPNIIEKNTSGDGYIVSSSGKAIEGVDDKYSTFSVYPYLVYDTRNSYHNPSSGEYGRLRFEFGKSNGYKGGTFTNLTFEARKYHKGLFKDNIFAYRFVAGMMSESTKESQRFWMGGGNTIRGYDGGDFRGTKKLLFNVENRTQLHELIGVVLFADIGRAWDQKGRDPNYLADAKFSEDIAVGLGTGLRLNTPLGLLRFDFGWPVGKQRDKEMRFYFNIGHTF